jgi:hypothetical protein
MPDTPQEEARIQPDVSPSAALPLAATPQAFGAGIGEGVQQVGDVAHELHLKAQRMADRSAILDADNQTNQFQYQRLYDARTGLLHQNPGRNAPALVDQTLADYDKHVSQVSAGLADDRQRLAYQRMANNRRYEMERTLGQFEHNETTRDADEVDQAAIAGATTNAVTAAGSPVQSPLRPWQQVSTDSIDRIKAVVQDQGERHGLSPDVVKERQGIAVSQAQLGILHQLVATGKDQYAKGWYDDHRGDFTAQDSPAAARLVEAGSIAGESQRISDEIGRGDDGNYVDRLTLEKRISEDPRLQADPKLREAVETRTAQQLDHHERAVSESQKAVFDRAYEITTDPDNPRGSYDDRVVAMRAEMTPQQREFIDNANAKSSRNPDLTNQLMVQAAKDPDGFLKTLQDPTMLAQVGRNDYQRLKVAADQIRKTGTIAEAAGILTNREVEDGALRDAGFAVQAKSGLFEIDRNSPDASKFLSSYNARVTAQEQATGRAASPVERQKIADEMVKQNVVSQPGFFKQPLQPVYRLTPAQRDAATRNLDDFAKLDPLRAAQMRHGLSTMASGLGVPSDRLTPDQYNRAFAQQVIATDLKLSGDRDGAIRAMERAKAILKEAATPPIPGSVPGIPRGKPARKPKQVGGIPIDDET